MRGLGGDPSARLQDSSSACHPCGRGSDAENRLVDHPQPRHQGHSDGPADDRALIEHGALSARGESFRLRHRGGLCGRYAVVELRADAGAGAWRRCIGNGCAEYRCRPLAPCVADRQVRGALQSAAHRCAGDPALPLRNLLHRHLSTCRQSRARDRDPRQSHHSLVLPAVRYLDGAVRCRARRRGSDGTAGDSGDCATRCARTAR